MYVLLTTQCLTLDIQTKANPLFAFELLLSAVGEPDTHKRIFAEMQ